jgi:hypothetical protein
MLRLLLVAGDGLTSKSIDKPITLRFPPPRPAQPLSFVTVITTTMTIANIHNTHSYDHSHLTTMIISLQNRCEQKPTITPPRLH